MFKDLRVTGQRDTYWLTILLDCWMAFSNLKQIKTKKYF